MNLPRIADCITLDSKNYAFPSTSLGTPDLSPGSSPFWYPHSYGSIASGSEWLDKTKEICLRSCRLQDIEVDGREQAGRKNMMVLVVMMLFKFENGSQQEVQSLSSNLTRLTFRRKMLTFYLVDDPSSLEVVDIELTNGRQATAQYLMSKSDSDPEYLTAGLKMGFEMERNYTEAEIANVDQLLTQWNCIELLRHAVRVQVGLAEESGNPLSHVGMEGKGFNMRRKTGESVNDSMTGAGNE